MASAPPRWDLFVGVAVFLTVVMLGLARASQQALSAPPAEALPAHAGESSAASAEDRHATTAVDADGDPPVDSTPVGEAAEGGPPGGESSPVGAGSSRGPLDARLFDTRLLLANVLVSHGLLGTFLLAAAWYAELPPAALGLVGRLSGALVPGVLLGVSLYAANEAAARLADLSGIEYDERLRELLAPETAGGWLVLLVVVLPIIAGVEELLFRGALIGAVAAGYGAPVWALAVVSSVLFGLGHGLQGTAGIVVTAALGLVLAAAFALTGSLWVVIVAHYLVNALEFVVHEGLS